MEDTELEHIHARIDGVFLSLVELREEWRREWRREIQALRERAVPRGRPGAKRGPVQLESPEAVE